MSGLHSVARTCLAVSCLLLIVPAGAVSSQNFRSGLSAYRSDDYRAAREHWRLAAERGNAKAQSALAYLYYRGLGVAQNYAEAAKWYRKAAEQDQPEAFYFLGTMYLTGQGVARDNVQAHTWCELALSSGIPAGLHCRDEAALAMTVDQVNESYRQAAVWGERAGKE